MPGLCIRCTTWFYLGSCFPQVAKCGNSFCRFRVVGKSGEIYAWGKNDSGELGIGNTTNQHKPQLVKLPDEVKNLKLVHVVVGYSHSTFVFTDAGLYISCWNVPFCLLRTIYSLSCLEWNTK